jgi:hypothetical protein
MSLADLEKRLQVVEDMEAIKKLHQNYINMMDFLRYDEIPDLFTDDATVEIRHHGVHRGKKKITEMYQMIKGTYKSGTPRHIGHFCCEPDISVEGDSARGTWLIYMLDAIPEPSWIQGINDCEYRKIDGKWYINKLKFTRTLASDPALYP